MVRGTPERVAAEVKEAVRVAALGGGYVLRSGNSLVVGTKYENYLALLAASREYGSYPVRLWSGRHGAQPRDASLAATRGNFPRPASPPGVIQ